MAEAGVRILSDEALAKRLSQGARDIAVGRFSSKAIVPQYEALYERVIGA
jgi:glycosyltransferase involved in cell wall biosynthesis